MKKSPIDITPFLRVLIRLEGGVKLSENKSLMEQFEDNRERMYSDDPDDNGGPTFCGITLTTYNDWAHRVLGPSTTFTKEDLQMLSFHNWVEVVKVLYWKALGCDQYYGRPHLALAVADFGFNSGVKRAAKYLQSVLNEINEITRAYQTKRQGEDGSYHQELIHIEEDGIVGRETLTAIQKVLRHATAEEDAVSRFCQLRRDFINRCVERGTIHEKYMRGLLKRVDYVESIQRHFL
ncbi:MAG: hypothetical protein IJQ44_05895 [Bacteroidaceae bacterium]|nr:hypothetical protein [Bacteroidaceae bacterium]